MSAPLDLDTKQGFLALPPSILDLEMSPGAFRVLAYLCNLASTEGWAWPSLQQIGDKMGRGKAAVSGYINELRELGLIETKNQKMASGYNYRLKFFVTFWSAWLKKLKEKSTKTKSSAEAPTPVRQTERSVLSSERPTSYKHKIHKTHTSAPAAPAAEVVKKIYDEWNDCARGAPYGQFQRPVSSDLVRRSEDVVRFTPVTPPKPVPANVLAETLSATWKNLNVDCPHETLNAQVQTLTSRGLSQECLEALVANIGDIWQHFWKYPPAPRQFEELVRKSSTAFMQQAHAAGIKRHLKNWKLTKQRLDERLSCCIVV